MEKVPQNCAQRQIVFKLCTHAADHLVNGWVSFDPENFRHIERSDFADQRNVIAQEINNHAVFRLIFGVVHQKLAVRLILKRGGTARHGALHRMGFDKAFAIHFKEEFRRTRQDDRATEIAIGRIANRLTLCERVEQHERIAVPFSMNRKVRLP